MSKFLAVAARIGGFATLSVSLAACGPDDLVGHNRHFALAQPGLLPSEASLYGNEFAPLLDALPLQAATSDYPLAPSWDYARGTYVDNEGFGGGYDEAGYFDDPYYDDGGYYDEEAGSDDYTWLALAALLAGVIGDSPPDYGFDYGGVQPWAWRTGDGYYRYAEPVYGGYRYYYYEPRADRPFLVRDPRYSYGYRDGRLAAIYDRDGRVLRYREAVRQRQAAERYYARAEALHRAALNQRRFGVSAPIWGQRRAMIAAEQRQWQKARTERAAWQRWDERHEAETARRWSPERVQRERAARQFAQWRDASYRGPAPRFYEPGREPANERQAALAQAQRRIALAHRQEAATRQQVTAERREAMIGRQTTRARRAVARGPVEGGRQVAMQRQAAERRVAAQQPIERRQQAAVRQQTAARQQVAARQQAERRERAVAQRQASDRREEVRRRNATEVAQATEAHRQAAVREQTQAKARNEKAVRAQAQQVRARQARVQRQAAEQRQAASRMAVQRQQAEARQQAQRRIAADRVATQRRQAEMQARQQAAVQRQQAHARQQQAATAQRQQAQAREMAAQRQQAEVRQQRVAAQRQQAQARQQQAEAQRQRAQARQAVREGRGNRGQRS